jgi:hypothetical protein
MCNYDKGSLERRGRIGLRHNKLKEQDSNEKKQEYYYFNPDFNNHISVGICGNLWNWHRKGRLGLWHKAGT